MGRMQQALREIYLVDVAGVDKVDGAAGGLQVVVLGKIASEIVDAGGVLRCKLIDGESRQFDARCGSDPIL